VSTPVCCRFEFDDGGNGNAAASGAAGNSWEQVEKD